MFSVISYLAGLSLFCHLKKEALMNPSGQLSLASVSPSPFINGLHDPLHFEGEKPGDVVYALVYCDPDGKNMEMVRSLGFRILRLVRN